MIIVQKRRTQGGFLMPGGGECLWYGLAAAVPADWEIVTFAYDCFVMGADTGGASDTPTSSNTHFHSNPAATSEEDDHIHPIHSSVGNASGSTGFYGTANSYTAPAGHGHASIAGNSQSDGGHDHSLAVTQNATVYPPYRRLYWIKAIRSTVFPVGGILMWDDDIAEAPEGFYLCDGEAHDSLTTPDLRDDFIYSASADGHVGAAGGAETHVHGNSVTGAAGAHSHGMSVNVGGSASSKNASGYEGTQVASGGHGHGLSATSNADDNHNHTLGNTLAASSLPPYLMLYFVMRTV